MHRQKRANDAVHWYMAELSSRVVAESGRPSDRHHLGKLILQSLKDAPDFIAQIDGATGESETNASVLKRSVRCAISLKNLGLQTGDVLVLMIPNYLDLTIPFIAALYLGIIIAPVDWNLTVGEFITTFRRNTPRIIFCESETATKVQLALNYLHLDAHIVTLDKGDYLCSLPEFLDNHGDDFPVEEFKPTDFDTEETIAFLIPTSGTTGLPKGAAGTHSNFSISVPYRWASYTNFPTPVSTALLASPLQWVTALFHFIAAPIMRYTRVQSSRSLNIEHTYYLINTYKPQYMIMSPTMMTNLIKPGVRDECDFTCFDTIFLAGSAVPPELITVFTEISPTTEVVNLYGMSELTGIGFSPDNSPPKSSGKPLGCFQYRLVDVQTNEDIVEPNIQGELWIKGPSIFKEYYKNPEATEEAFASDRWFKTGDIFYKDVNCNFYFVERYKLLLKYMSHHISTVELETVIRQHPAVLDVAVIGIPDPKCGDLAVACIVRQPNSDVTADDIKVLVNESLTDTKQLRGGVIFMDEIPLTASTKVHRRKLKDLALNMERL